MARKHLFPLVVILAAAAVAGLLAVSHTRALGQPTSAATGSDPAIAFRLKKLDRFERSLRRQLAHASKAGPSTRTTVYRAASVASSGSSQASEDDHSAEDEHESDDRDD